MLQEDAEPLESFFELNDTLFAKAHIPQTEEVYLWLGVGLCCYNDKGAWLCAVGP